MTERKAGHKIDKKDPISERQRGKTQSKFTPLHGAKREQGKKTWELKAGARP